MVTLYLTWQPTETIFWSKDHYEKKKCPIKVFDLCWQLRKKMSRPWKAICIQTVGAA